MRKEYNLITDFDFTLIADFFTGLDRQGPGNDDQTRRALGLLGELPPRPLIADIGCGTGRQTAALLRELPDARATAVDLLPEMIDGLRRRMAAEALADRVTGIVASMESLPFADASFDLLWAEGSIYNVGFERGLEAWRRFLKTGGYVAVTDCSWLCSARPDRMEFFRDNFPDIDDIAGKIGALQRAGYRPLAHFILPDECWTEEFYLPATLRAREFLEAHNNAPIARVFVKRLEEEIDQYHRYGDLYGYVFYIGQKTD